MTDALNSFVESIGGYGVFAAAWVWAILSIYLIVIVIHLFNRRHANESVRIHMKKKTPEFDELIEKVAANTSDDAEIRRVLPPAAFPYFARYIEHRLAGTGNVDASVESTIAEKSGFADHLRKRIQKHGGWKRALALRSLSYLRNSRDIELFRSILETDRFKHAIFAAALGLGLCGDTESLEAVLRKLYVETPSNRDMVLSTLLAYGNKGADAMNKVLASAELVPAVQGVIVDFLGTLKHRPALPTILKLLKHATDKEAAIHFMEALEKIGSEKDCEVLLPYLKDSDFRMRLKAINALERLAGSRYLDEAEQLMNDESPWVTRNAAEAISRMGPDGLARLKALAHDRNERKRLAAKMVIAEREFGRIRWRYRYANSIP